jgi:hypothetical protein
MLMAAEVSYLCGLHGSTGQVEVHLNSLLTAALAGGDCHLQSAADSALTTKPPQNQ